MCKGAEQRKWYVGKGVTEIRMMGASSITKQFYLSMVFLVIFSIQTGLVHARSDTGRTYKIAMALLLESEYYAAETRFTHVIQDGDLETTKAAAYVINSYYGRALCRIEQGSRLKADSQLGEALNMYDRGYADLSVFRSKFQQFRGVFGSGSPHDEMEKHFATIPHQMALLAKEAADISARYGNHEEAIQWYDKGLMYVGSRTPIYTDILLGKMDAVLQLGQIKVALSLLSGLGDKVPYHQLAGESPLRAGDIYRIMSEISNNPGDKEIYLARARDAKLVAEVSHIDGNTIALDAGSSKGLKIGLRGRVYYELTIGDEVVNIYIAKIVLTKVDTNTSTAKVEAKSKALEPGLLVEIEELQDFVALIPAGEFRMGSNHGGADEKPVHSVYVDAFYIDRYEVTNVQYAKFLNEFGKNTDGAGHKLLKISSPYCQIWKAGEVYRPRSGYEEHPVVEVSWYGANAYAEFYGKWLPTEAEWEKAARGGLAGKKYPWGDSISHDNANYNGTGRKDKWTNTSPVGSFSPNGYGLYDMSGNVWEWCSDWYSSDYYAQSTRRNPSGPGTGRRRVIRGGSWSDDVLRCAYRATSDLELVNLGFRCASKELPSERFAGGVERRKVNIKSGGTGLSSVVAHGKEFLSRLSRSGEQGVAGFHIGTTRTGTRKTGEVDGGLGSGPGMGGYQVGGQEEKRGGTTGKEEFKAEAKTNMTRTDRTIYRPEERVFEDALQGDIIRNLNGLRKMHEDWQNRNIPDIPKVLQITIELGLEKGKPKLLKLDLHKTGISSKIKDDLTKKIKTWKFKSLFDGKDDPKKWPIKLTGKISWQ